MKVPYGVLERNEPEQVVFGTDDLVRGLRAFLQPPPEIGRARRPSDTGRARSAGRHPRDRRTSPREHKSRGRTGRGSAHRGLSRGDRMFRRSVRPASRLHLFQKEPIQQLRHDPAGGVGRSGVLPEIIAAVKQHTAGANAVDEVHGVPARADTVDDGRTVGGLMPAAALEPGDAAAEGQFVFRDAVPDRMRGLAPDHQVLNTIIPQRLERR